MRLINEKQAKRIKKVLFFTTFLLLRVQLSWGQFYPPTFDSVYHVNEYPQRIPPGPFDRVEKEVAKFEKLAFMEVKALVIESTDNYCTITEYTDSISKLWGVGKYGSKNNIFIVIAAEDKTAKIVTGSRMEVFIPDSTADVIVLDYILEPYFYEKVKTDPFDYTKCIQESVEVMTELARGKIHVDDIHNPRITVQDVITVTMISIVVFMFGVIIWIIWNSRYQKPTYDKEESIWD
ncbi:MAG: TPM domain-containing protein [Cytophagales bacterium]|nr:TPM domain-containing protein [Cytophagales bacterium]